MPTDTTGQPDPRTRWPAERWQAARAAHERRVDALLAAHHARRRHRVRHPVEDFLFTYYSFRPAQLRRWHPGPGIVLSGGRAEELGPGYTEVPGGATVDVPVVLARRGDGVRWIADLLAATAGRPAQFGCFGMHEWAMVYQLPAEQVRHSAWPLRLSAAHTAAVLTEIGPRCTHFDAFRFFTEPARPLNPVPLTRASQLEYEQPGCLHANMDLYKLAYKLTPLVPAELVVDCFELARDIRALDMRASPYDLAELGYPAVPVETPAGRARYAAAQREFTARAAPLRDRLIDCCRVALGRVSAAHSPEP